MELCIVIETELVSCINRKNNGFFRWVSWEEKMARDMTQPGHAWGSV